MWSRLELALYGERERENYIYFEVKRNSELLNYTVGTIGILTAFLAQCREQLSGTFLL